MMKDKEFDAMKRIVTILDGLDEAALKRVLHYIMDRLHLMIAVAGKEKA